MSQNIHPSIHSSKRLFLKLFSLFCFVFLLQSFTSVGKYESRISSITENKKSITLKKENFSSDKKNSNSALSAAEKIMKRCPSWAFSFNFKLPFWLDAVIFILMLAVPPLFVGLTDWTDKQKIAAWIVWGCCIIAFCFLPILAWQIVIACMAFNLATSAVIVDGL